MNKLRALLVVALLSLAAPAHAQWSLSNIGSIYIDPSWFVVTWKCEHWDHRACSDADLANGYYRQVLLLSAGFQESERNDFWSEFDRTVTLMTDPNTAGSSWSVQKRDRILFVGWFTGGGALGTASASFGAKIAQHPVRGYATSLSNDAVYSYVANTVRASLPHLSPLSAGVMFNSFQTQVTANASPPSFLGKSYGVGKFTRDDLNSRGAYVPTHELAHAGLNFLDEYVEKGFEDLNIRQLDILTPLALFDWTWGGFINAISNLLGVYDYNLSEILANNGNENIALSSWPSTVGGSWLNYAYEGGMFFGRGTFHQPGNNLMNGNNVMRGPDDGFGFAHSGDQQAIVDQAFGGGANRPNDRLRNAGPKSGWPLAFGSDTHVMLYDGDKLHHFHPTQSYAVQVGWYDRQWHTCWAGFIPYPCYNDVWTTAQKWVTPSTRSIDVKLTSAYGLADLAQRIACGVGYTEVNGIQLCQQDLNTVADNFLPTLKFLLPYQDVTVPATQWMTTYWWRFSTWNGTYQSNWTGWSSFYRSL